MTTAQPGAGQSIAAALTGGLTSAGDDPATEATARRLYSREHGPAPFGGGYDHADPREKEVYRAMALMENLLGPLDGDTP